MSNSTKKPTFNVKGKYKKNNVAYNQEMNFKNIPKIKLNSNAKIPTGQWTSKSNQSTDYKPSTKNNIGLVCNKDSGIIGVDLDFYTKTDKDGTIIKKYDPINIKEHKQFIDLFGSEYIKTFDTLTQETTNGGFHLIFKHTEDLKQTQNDIYNIDIRGGNANGYLVGSGSIVNGKEYKIINDTTIKPFPQNLKDFLINNIYPTKENKKNNVKPNLLPSTKGLNQKNNGNNGTNNGTNGNGDKEVREIVQNISLKYLDTHHSWMRIVWGLKFLGENYKEIAKTISKKSKKYTDNGFETVWNSAKYKGISKGTLYHYSKVSNLELFHKIIARGKISLADHDIAKLFIKLQGDNLVYKRYPLGADTYIYNGNTWFKQCNDCIEMQNQITTTIIKYCDEYDKVLSKEISETEDEDAKETIRKRKATLGKIIIKVKQVAGSKSVSKKVVQILSSMTFDNVEFDNIPDMIPFKNKIFDLNTFEFRNYKNNDYVLTKLSYDYIKPTTEQMETVKTLFKQIFPNEDIRNDYKTILSTTLFGRPVDKFIISNGGGGNGKSVLHELLIEALEEGTLAYVAPVSVILSTLKQGNNPEVASMNNKRMVVYREPAENELINIGTMKELTGSTTINARMNYSNDTKTILKATHILEANKTPKMKGQMDNSIKRRVIDIKFESTFTMDEDLLNEPNHFKVNPYYRDQEFKETHKFALIKYLINFIMKFNKNNSKKVYENIKVSSITQQGTDTYIQSSDFLLSFTKKYIIKNDEKNSFIKIKELYQLFKTSDEYGNLSKEERRTYNEASFKDTLKRDAYFRKIYKDIFKPYINGNQKCYNSVLVGYSIKDDEY
tara:strand:- start:5031 stop:7538 length:2508 start_codon:yes stop_codon:yes gene_type:complete